MKNCKRLSSLSFRCQGLVEFALIIPILLVLIFGVIEAGRALFTYVVVVSTSREAARYGAAVGTNQAGIPFYRDCAGIRAAARRVAILANIPDSDITITYEHNDGTPYGSCPPNITKGPAMTALGDRIRVTVKGKFKALVPLVPLRDFDIQATTARTIISDVSVGSENFPITPILLISTIFKQRSAINLSNSFQVIIEVKG
ncbi:MAG: TadE family protein [Anaerolineales bacterium]